MYAVMIRCAFHGRAKGNDEKAKMNNNMTMMIAHDWMNEWLKHTFDLEA